MTVNPCVTYESPRRNRRCPELQRSIVILSNGDIVPCCGDYDGVLAFGSVVEQPDLRRHYNNRMMRELHKRSRIPEAMPEICSKCTVASWPR